MPRKSSNKPSFSERWVRFENALRPFLLPATGGVLMAVICFCLIMGSQVVPMTNTPDVTVQVVTPARVQELAPMDFNTGDNRSGAGDPDQRRGPRERVSRSFRRSVHRRSCSDWTG